MITTTRAKRTRASKPEVAPEPAPAPPVAATGSKLEQLASLLLREQGATIAELTTATGWQPHSVRGALAGALRKKGLAISSTKVDGTRRYQASRPA